MYPLLLCQPFFVSAPRVLHWPLLPSSVGLRHLILHGNELAGGARYPPASHLVLLFATLLTLPSRLVFSVADVVVVVVGFMFQVAGVDMDMGIFAGVSVGGSVFQK